MTRLGHSLYFAWLLVPFVAFSQSYNGYHDTTNCSIIGGWAVDNNQLDTPINVDIYDGNSYVTTTSANLYRADLGWIHYYHAFNITTPASLKNSANHTINVKYGGTNLLLPNTGQLLNCAPNSTGYQYYYSDTFSSINPAAWYQNGSGLTTTSAGLTSADPNGGSLISKAGVPDGTSQYEVKATLNLTQSGGTYGIYLRGSSNALSAPTATGTYYAAEIQNVTFSGGVCSATFAFYKRVNNSITFITSGAMACNNGMTIRLIYTHDSWIYAYANNVPAVSIIDADIASGQPGVGVRGAPATNGIARVDLGPLDRIAPTVMQNPITSSAFPDHIDLKWGGSVDDPNGIGLGYSLLYRTLNNNRSYVSYLQPGVTSYSDYGVTHDTSYTYTVYVFDYHLNSTSFSFPASTPPVGSIDPREVGVRPLGSYWGGAGEQVDMRSGNLNYSLPLIKALGRGGWGVGINLSYNSQNWRQDPAGVWQLGRDTGYGYGWRLQAGSLTPVYQDYWTIHHWLFIDSTGAEYKLNQWNGGVWSSVEGIYLAFDANVTGSPASTHLYFPDGSFWELNALSAGTEQDAGTYYPSLMQDTNGNQILFTYKPGLGVSYPNSSARIATIEDVRGSGLTDYTFTYDSTQHLTDIANGIGTSESYHLTYSQTALMQPFGGTVQNFGTFSLLGSVRVNGPNLTTSFTYNPVSGGDSGELTQMTTPYQGYLKWAYGSGNYLGSRSLREVQNRYLMLCGASWWGYCSWNPRAELAYTLSRDVNTALTFHATAAVLDADGHGEKDWYFDTTSTDAGYGLAYRHEDRLQQGQGANPIGGRRDDYTWVTEPNSGNPYIQAVLTTEDYGNASQIQKKTTQTIDQYGNLLQTAVYDYGNPPTLTRTYNYSYVTDPTFADHANYINRHITNRLRSSFVNGGTQTATFVQNIYDNSGYSYVTNVTGMHEHDDANYGTGYVYRGNVTSSTTLTGTKTAAYDMGGNVTGTSVNGVSTTITVDSTKNYAVPSKIQTNSLPVNATWNSFFGLSTATDPNNDTSSFGYDSNGRPSSTTSPYGAQTIYTYNDSATGSTPPNRVATTNGHYVQTSVDGFGRTLVTLSNYNGSGTSAVQTFYGPCGCSPLGKISQVTQPFVSGAQNIYWTKYTYDGLGRTTSVAVQETASVYSTTTYVYHGNTVTVTDPAGKTKTFAMDAFGNLTSVQEPDPTLGTVTTNYTYDILNHLIRINMPRGTTPPQPDRTFNYTPTGTNNPGAFLLSAANPENGTVNYTYSNGLLASKTDAKGQAFTYQYDGYNRLWKVFVGGSLLRTFYYDSDPVGFSAFSQYGAGRLTAVTYPAIGNIMLTDRYSYTGPGYAGAGLPAVKRLQVSQTLNWIDRFGYQQSATPQVNLDASYSYNNEGKITSMTYPATSSGPAQTYNYSYDGGYRLSGMTDAANNALVNNVSYGPSNELLTMNYRTFAPGSFTAETRGYNNLVQLTSLTAGTLSATYNYPTGSNNGKISSSVINGENVTYQYDSLNRLISAQSSSGWGEQYGFDGFGNLTTKTGSGGAPQLSVNVNPLNNQISGVSGLTYDPNGNELYGGVTYDAENRIAAVPGLQYAYDAQNKRTFSWDGTLYPVGPNASNYSVFLYSPGGQKLGTYLMSVVDIGTTDHNLTLQSSVVTSDLFFGGRRLAIQDRLGSVGSYFPYGEARPGTNPQNTWSFATYWRDSATSLDYADQRYYSNQFARFMSPDPSRSSAGPTDPGSWNRYAYTRGDPINRLDPEGLADFSIDVYAFLQFTGGGAGGSGGDGYGGRPMPWDEMGKKAYLALLASNRADNKAAAQDRLKKIAAGFDPSGKCLDFLQDLANTMKGDVSVNALISEIKDTAALAASQVYDGVTSGTELTEEKFPGERDRTGMSTVGQWFGSAGNNAIALSQFNGAAIFMNLNLSYGDQYGMGILLHELLHKESVGGGSSHAYINFALNAVDAPPGAVGQTDDMGSRIGQICFH